MNIPTLIRNTAAALLLGLAQGAAAQVQDLGEGSMQVAGGGQRILPLKHTEVRAEISGFVAEVSVTQVFGNPADKPIEAVYVFPLPENAAVNDMTLVVGDRRIKGQIKKREEARQVYEQAKAQGRTAALLDQERPNIFTQSVANIPPGKEIRVTLKYIQNLGYDHGVYKFSFPMTVGPRYIPGQASGRTGTGWSPDTDVVRDASLITPPVVAPGRRSGRDISLEVRLNAGIAVKNIRSSSHDVALKELGGNSYGIALDPEDRIPNKDFLLTYEPAGKAVDAAVLAHKTGEKGYLTLMLQPAAEFPLSQVTAKELVFALDVSGSMSGFPVETAKAAALKCLEGMNPGDTFQIFSFASGNQLHFAKPLKNTPENVALGRQVIHNLQGGGGTEMLEALRTVLEFPKDPARVRIVLFMTDGYIGNEAQILSFIKAHLNNSRIFPLGVGSSPNTYLLEEMAVMGRGTVQYVRQAEKPARLEKVVEKFYDRISRPVLTDLSVDWNGLDVTDQEPGAIQDLFAGQPVFVHARYGKGGYATVALKGKLRGQPWAMPVRVTLPEKEAANAAMGPLWARARITGLSRRSYGGADPDVKEKITMLGLEHSLVTEHTSFVAVDESTSTGDGKPLVVPVESELPEGARHEGFFSRPGAAATAGSGGGFGGMVAAVRGAFGQAKASNMATPSLGFGCRMGGPADAALPEPAEEKEKKPLVTAPAGQGRVAALAAELLAAPSERLARQLVATQDAAGAFVEEDGTPAAMADQALAVLALCRAGSLYGKSYKYAVELGWAWLKLNSPKGLGGRRAVTNALKGGAWFNRAGVRAELEAQGAALDALN